MAFLLQGVGEANPLLRWGMDHSGSPIHVLLIAKAFALVLALICLRQSRSRLLQGVNLFFASLVAYNLVALILASPVLHASA